MQPTIRTHASIAEIDAARWNQLAGRNATLGHEFLSALETSGSATPATGWSPRHLTLWDGEQLAAAIPMFEKSHSFGEFVFDWSWAEAFERAGLDYYPKLVSAVPFTPVTGQRLLARDPGARRALIAAVLTMLRADHTSSLHILFPSAEERALLGESGFAIREGVQFHWHNRGFRDFGDFLDSLTRDKRKKLRQERRRVGEGGIRLQRIAGADASAEDWQFFYRCYLQTYAERDRQPYLTRRFFDALARSFATSLVLVMAYRGEVRIAAALSIVDGERMYGRYWGATEFVPGLHFETCYYQGIEHCIAAGLSVFEGGAQGEHKLARGFIPVRTYSAHWLREARFAAAVHDFVARESQLIGRYFAELIERSPYRGDRVPDIS